jgi:hypothetical protein
MPEQFDQTESDDTGASESSEEAQPSPTDAVLEAVMARLGTVVESAVAKRIPGLQSAYDKKYGELATQFDQFKKASLSPEELEEQEQTDARTENEKLRQENQLLRLRANHPDAVDLITGAMGTATLEEQIAFIESKLGKKVVAEVEEAVEEAADEAGESGESIPNPGKPPKMGAQSASFAGEMNNEMADAVLANQPRGALARIFKGG